MQNCLAQAGKTGATAAVFGNRLLDRLPREELGKITPLLRRVFLQRGMRLDAEQHAETLFFPVDALVSSSINTTGTGRQSPLAVVGRCGAVDMTEAHFGPTVTVATHVVCSGTAWTLTRGISTSLAIVLRRYERALFAAAAARLACNAEHNVDRRVARWLLFVADEMGKAQVEMTHQQLAEMAAIRRPSVSLVFSDLSRRGMINAHHGLVEITDRERLERETCPCYYAIRELLDRAPLF